MKQEIGAKLVQEDRLVWMALEEFQETEDPKVIKGSGGPLGPPDPLVERLSSEGPRDLRGLLESQESQEYQESLGELGNWGKWGDPARRV